MAFNGVLHQVRKDSSLKAALFASASVSLGEEIMLCVDAAFAQDSAIDEVGLVFSAAEPSAVGGAAALSDGDAVTRRRAVARASVVLHEHKLGLAFSALPALYSAARALFVRRPLADGVAARATRSMLLVNADCYVAWAMRKRLVVRSAATAEGEIALCDLVLTQHPKSMETWTHREWALRRALGESADASQRASLGAGAGASAIGGVGGGSNTRSGGSAAAAPARAQLALLQRELRACAKACSDYPRNYYAWTHRLRVCRRLAHGAASLVAMFETNELAWSERWLRSHVSDHAGATHRQSVVRLCLAALARAARGADADARAERLVQRERRITLELLKAYPGHETLWEHRRFVVATLVERTVVPGAAEASARAVDAVVEEDAELDANLRAEASAIAEGALLPSERRALREQRRHAASYALWRAALLRRTRAPSRRIE